MKFVRQIGAAFAAVALTLAPIPGLCSEAGDGANKVIGQVVGTHYSGASSQQRIDRIDDQTRQLLEQYRVVTRQTETLEVYNEQLQVLIESQMKEMQSIQQQIQAIEVTQREVMPLMLRMVQSLEQFIELDVPFLPKERQLRLDNLKQTLARADVSVSEKFRQVVEAYQIENDYGRTIEAYRSTLTGSDASVPRTVDFLRVGRVALYYQTLDGQELGAWDNRHQQWQFIDGDYRSAINKGLRIARKQAAPDLLVLPVDAPENAPERRRAVQ